MHLPIIPNPLSPTMRQANNCVVYLANNLQKKDGGNFIYGSATYVMNPRLQSKKWAVNAYDTGAFAQYIGVHWGTHENFYHLIQAHEKATLISFAQMFNRWWANGSVPHGHGASLFDKFPYFEYEHFGACQLPEDLLYMIMKFSTGDGGQGYWGKDLGKQAQQFLSAHNRPMVWGDTEDGGMIIDPTVGNIFGGRITAADKADFEQKWSQGISFKELYDSVPNHLKFFYRSWDKKAACEVEEADAINQVMGVDGDGNCVYWKWYDPKKWEMAIDGTCFQSDDSERAVYNSQSACSDAASKFSVKYSKGPRGTGHYCEPDPQGKFGSVVACERGFHAVTNEYLV